MSENLAITILNRGGQMLHQFNTILRDHEVEATEDDKERLKDIGEAIGHAHMDMVDYLVDKGIITEEQILESIKVSEAHVQEWSEND